MVNGIYTAPIYKLKKLSNLFIEMTGKNCNNRCPSCFINFPACKNVKDFISIEAVKQALCDTRQEDLQCIYLSGAEPMTHPDFNAILRLCLKRCCVCICTNSSFLNEKKIRFLKKVEDEGENQIIFKFTLAHFDEIKSDEARYRGNYRQVMSAIKIAARYNFNVILTIQNYYDLPENEIETEFKRIFAEHNLSDVELQIIPSYPTKNECCINAEKTDCTCGRTLTSSGIYSCPFLANDYRGRLGYSFADFSKSVSAETDFCTLCSLKNGCIFSIE